MKMANEKKSIIEEALLEAEQIDAAFKSNAKEILSQTMSSEIEEMVKESLTGSKKRLKEEDEEEEMDLDLDLDTEEGEEEGEESEESEEMDLDMDTEEGEESEEMDLDLDMDMGGEDMDMDLDLGDESEEGSEMDLDMDMENEPSGEEMETVDLTNVSDDSKLISVFKKMGPEDEIEVVNDNGMVTLKDNKSGSEYRIELNSTGGVSNVESSEIELGEGTEESGEIIYEIVVDDEDEMSDYMMDYASDEDEMMDHMDHMDYASDEDEMSYMDYKKSGLKHPEKADLNKDHDISSYEKKRGMAIEKSMEKDNEDEMSYMDYASDYAEDEDYMARRKTTKGRYATGNRTNINAINRMGGAESYKSTYGMSESKTPQITKLIKENTNLNTKNSTLETENAELKDTQEKMVEALKQFRKKLQEVAVFNSNLTYAVRLFTENSTTKEEKQEILKRLDSAKDLKESQSIYKQLVKEYTNGKTPIKESIEEKINKTASSGAQISEQSVFVHPELQNMKKLWEYSYKK